ncbi:endonuclease-3 [Methanohalophilus levihalophilus]|uniref:endonuclease III n=1 Tax=Methanohalophilus levihalophilus TaxID=1431282 RepID=UPI001AEB39C9|nr:endonuclease III [Methanohalophilus levihalophilus]MBP2030749.1 endonuclease-3 [Methanohalophilus levihalophilus]
MEAPTIFAKLKQNYTPQFFLDRHDPFYVLISTVLSQRTRDEVTQVATRRLFKHYDTPEDFAAADAEAIENLIKDVGFYRMKAPRVIQIASILLEKYGGEVPEDMDLLLELPGVGRKTANCVLAYAFSKDVIAVDTHVHRISNRLGIVDTSNPDQTEIALQAVLPEDMWRDVNELLVSFGKEICRPISPKCGVCPIEDMCAKLYLKKSD